MRLLKQVRTPLILLFRCFAHPDVNRFPAALHFRAGAITALLTNPIWVVKVRLFTTPPNDPNAYRGLWDGLWSVAKHEGVRGLYKGTILALFGVTNGALQFMAYEEMKKLGFARQKRKAALAGEPYDETSAKLVSVHLLQFPSHALSTSISISRIPPIRSCLERQN